MRLLSCVRRCKCFVTIIKQLWKGNEHDTQPSVPTLRCISTDTITHACTVQSINSCCRRGRSVTWSCLKDKGLVSHTGTAFSVKISKKSSDTAHSCESVNSSLIKLLPSSCLLPANLCIALSCSRLCKLGQDAAECRSVVGDSVSRWRETRLLR